MGYRTDGVLGVLALAAFAGALVAVDAPVSVPVLALGAAGTVAFEVVAFRRGEVVREYWERPPVQLGSLARAVGLAAAGAVVAPSIVLSAGVGAVGTYLVVLALVLAGAIGPGEGPDPPR